MCFSAQASFTASGLLAAMTFFIQRKRTSKKQLMLSYIPFLFAIQQGLEGVVWLTANNKGWINVHHKAAVGFLVFAYIIWPIWIPRSLEQIETNPLRKTMLHILTHFGFIFALATFFIMLHINITASVSCNIIYAFTDFVVLNYVIFLYAIPTVCSFFVSSNRFYEPFWFFAFSVSYRNIYRVV